MKTPTEIFIEKDVVFTYLNKQDTIEMYLDILNTLTNFFIAEITKYFTTDEEILYISNNLLRLYELKTVDLYVRKYLNNSLIDFSYSTKTIQERQDALMVIDKSYRLLRTNNLDANIIYNKIKGYGYSFALSLHISLI